MQYTKQRVINKAIPDNDPKGIVDTIKILHDGTVESIRISLNISHNYNGDLSVDLKSPTGKTVRLLKPGRTPGKDIQQSFDGALFAEMIGESAKGNWKIKVVDSGPRDEGKLVDWSLSLDMSNAQESEIFIQDEKLLHSHQYVHQGGSIKDISAKVNIDHGYIGDLIIAITAPSGKKVTIHDKAGGGSKNLQKNYSREELQDFIGETAEGLWKLTINDTMPRDNGQLNSWHLNMTCGKLDLIAEPQDLTKIEGIGPKINELLNERGIFTFDQLANTAPSDIKLILDDAGSRFQMHDPGSWPRQSRLAADDKWEELAVLQDELDGGK